MTTKPHAFFAEPDEMFTLEELVEAARICRVRKITQPYFEMLK